MNLLAANLVATLLSFCAAIMIGLWYLAPAVARRPLADALAVLVWFHAFRYVALQIFGAAEVGGLSASSAAQRTIAFGDLATSVVALITLWALRRRLLAGRALAWLVAVIGTADLVSATIVGINGKLTDTATDLSWLILAFYVPVLWITAVMLFWQLISRRRELLGPPNVP
jgi:hypothetical protein